MITVVSGLPRSGTSMMMQMLEAGGMEIFTDKIRKPNESNPRGYYEFEPVKKLDKDTSWVKDAEGCVVKVVAHWLQYLPSEFQYSVIFMERNITEVLKSQEKMLEVLGRPDTSTDKTVLARSFRRHVHLAKNLLDRLSNVRTLYVQHYDVIYDSLRVAENINTFLGGNLDVQRMAATVDEKLYRQRVSDDS